MFLDNEKLVEILKNKLEEGYNVIAKTKISSPECKTAIINMFEINATIEGLTNSTKEAKELNDFDKEMKRIQKEKVKKALAKNKDIEVSTKKKGGNK